MALQSHVVGGYEFLDDTDDDDAPPPRSTADITEAEKYEFLRHVQVGLNRSEAAHILGYKGRHFRSLCSPKSIYYDEAFAHDYGQAISSLEYEHNRLERLRDEAQRRAMSGSDRLLEKLLMVHDPDWEVLRTKEVNVNIEAVVTQYFKGLPTDKLQQILAWVEEQEQIEDAEFQALPPPDKELAA